MFSLARGFTPRLIRQQPPRSLPSRESFSFSKTSPPPDFLWQLFGGGNEVNPGTVEGTDLCIVEYPHPALRAVNEEISEEELKSQEISKLAKDMLKVMYAAEGVGLAAPQVGVNKRLMVYNASGDSKKWLEETILVNPKIVEYSEAKDIATEGCLSFPDMQGDVSRSKWIKVHAVNLQGRPVKKKFTGWEARIFQHEYDHLDGVVYVDRLSEEGRTEVQPRLNELITVFGEGGAV
jgi:peptide deformylase